MMTNDDEILKKMCEKENIGYKNIIELLKFEKDKKFLKRQIKIQDKIEKLLIIQENDSEN